MKTNKNMIGSKFRPKEMNSSCIVNGKLCKYLRNNKTYCACEDEMHAMCIPEYK